jgi:probable phosphoglycerate mutase
MTRLVLVRHGEASGNREMRYLGATDAPLTVRGRAQAAEVARAAAAFGLAAVYASPLRRARETAEAIAAAAGLELTVEPELRETDYGEWEGLTRREAMERAPELLRRWEADPEAAPPGGESLAATLARVAACADALAARHAGGTLALVSHVGPIKALVCAALGLDAGGARRMWLDPASLSVVEWPAEPGRVAALRVFNASGHLSEGVRWMTGGARRAPRPDEDHKEEGRERRSTEGGV